MTFLLIGVAALALGIVLLQAFARADIARLAQRLRAAAGVVVLAAAAFMLVRGVAVYAFPLAMLGIWLIWGRGGMPWPGIPGGRQGKQSGNTSKVVTDHLEMELDHDTGAMHGRVLKGFFAGRDLGDLRPVELAHLWQDCRFVDPQSAQLVEAYLDRVHPSWRDDLARSEAESPKGPDGKMTVEEAQEILGLAPGASDEEIRHAHRELMLRLHPDRGGSTYLAAKINEAKDVLLNRN